MRVEIEVERACPAEGVEPHRERFRVEVPRYVTVLDTLIQIKDELEGSLTFRRSCRSAICGSCAMRINGRSGLACDTLVETELRRFGRILVQPLALMPVAKDLAIEYGPFWKRVRAVKPWVSKEGPDPAWPVERESLMDQHHVEELDDASRCIMCMACFSACESAAVNDRFLGPAALAKAYRFVADPRDAERGERLTALDGAGGIWDCTRCNQCVEACPKDVKPMEQIVALRRDAIRDGLTDTIGSRHITEFIDIVRQEGRLNEGRMPIKMKKGNPLELALVAPLALRMLRKGKLPLPYHPPIPRVREVRRIIDRKGSKT
jgi:succinate dehydrogenase / fumarate reductase iron-sulfur subunit